MAKILILILLFHAAFAQAQVGSGVSMSLLKIDMAAVKYIDALEVLETALRKNLLVSASPQEIVQLLKQFTASKPEIKPYDLAAYKKRFETLRAEAIRSMKYLYILKYSKDEIDVYLKSFGISHTHFSYYGKLLTEENLKAARDTLEKVKQQQKLKLSSLSIFQTPDLIQLIDVNLSSEVEVYADGLIKVVSKKSGEVIREFQMVPGEFNVRLARGMLVIRDLIERTEFEYRLNDFAYVRSFHLSAWCAALFRP